MISFPAALTIRHLIDEQSPLYGATAASLEASNAFFLASTVSIELVMAPPCKVRSNTPGKTSVSASASSMSTPKGKADDSP